MGLDWLEPILTPYVYVVYPRMVAQKTEVGVSSQVDHSDTHLAMPGRVFLGNLAKEGARPPLCHMLITTESQVRAQTL